jgi:cytochrome c1
MTRHSGRPGHRLALAAGIGVAVAIVAAAVGKEILTLTARSAQARAAAVTGGDPARGADLVRAYGCGYCHIVPGVRGARGLVGPSLERVASRVYIGGVLANTPRNLQRWLQDPPAVDPRTAMPNVGVTAEDARDLAAYLYTLR